MSCLKSTIPLILFACTLFSCTKNYEITPADPIEYGGEMWHGYFIANKGKHIPFSMGIKEEEPAENGRRNRYGRILSGHDLYSAIIYNEGEFTRMQAGLHSYFIGKLEGDIFEGVLMDGVSEQHPKAPFKLKRNAEPPFKPFHTTSKKSATGRWNLDFGTLKDLSDMSELLRYNIDRARVLDLFQSENGLVYAKTYIGGAGIQGFHGAMTKNGFTCASYHHSEPFLLEVEFIDNNHFDGVITSVTDTYKVKGTRESSVKTNTEHTTSVVKGFYLFVKGFFKW